ncbi:hypothetical protein GALMADRAFT_213526 [Galerina marginata CBS 339.88]|uniref:Uncharacterized protein n=1 Tax=Galerina marginata (strain CBS 339.88) TaxID=685588 RepID=A0A067SZ89_GALM3|nr:hypothetical protein GALMADRAFT_213526 [Galerina marginata CBS 339.88]
MPSIRGLPPPPSRSDKVIYTRARFYGQRNRPLWKLVQTQITSRRRRAAIHACRRYPWVEGIFEHRNTQPFVHDTSITVRHNGREHIFFVFCQNHCRLPFNNAVVGPWRGNIVVMKAGSDVSGVVDMRSQDAELVDQAINEFVFRVKQKSPFRFPKKLVFNI